MVNGIQDVEMIMVPTWFMYMEMVLPKNCNMVWFLHFLFEALVIEI